MTLKGIIEGLTSSQFSQKTLSEVFSQLEKHPDVEAVLMIGSGAGSELKPYSDFDVPIILRQNTGNIFATIAYIEGKVGEFYFFDKTKLLNTINAKEVDANSIEGKLIEWSRTAKIIFDKSGIVEKLSKKIGSLSITDTVVYNNWHSVNYNYWQNKRYFLSQDPLYLQALEIRLLYSVPEILVAYFSLRGKPWRGEKKAVTYFKENDHEFSTLFDRYTKALTTDEKFRLYEDMASRALEPFGGLVGEEKVLVEANDQNDPESIKKAYEYWDSLLG